METTFGFAWPRIRTGRFGQSGSRWVEPTYKGLESSNFDDFLINEALIQVTFMAAIS